MCAKSTEERKIIQLPQKNTSSKGKNQTGSQPPKHSNHRIGKQTKKPSKLDIASQRQRKNNTTQQPPGLEVKDFSLEPICLY